MTIEDRYRYDKQFKQLVDIFRMYIMDGKFTPTEIREGAMLAQVIYESEILKPILIEDINELRRK